MNRENQNVRQFLSMRLTPQNMTFYTVRTSILESVRRETRSFYGRVLDVGCGFMPYRSIVESVPEVSEYVGMDLEHSEYYAGVEPQIKWNGQLDSDRSRDFRLCDGYRDSGALCGA